MQSNNALAKFVTGSLEKRHYRFLFWGGSLYLLTCFILAQAFFPGGYSMFEQVISSQGDPSINPLGAPFFIAGVGVTGALLVVYFTWLHRRLLPRTPKLTWSVYVAAVIGSVGFSMVGIFPMSGMTGIAHDVGATLAFTGLGTAAVLSLPVFIAKIMRKDPWPSKAGFLAMLSVVLVLALLVFIADSYTRSQWLAFFTLLAWIIGTYMLAPNDASVCLGRNECIEK